MAASPIPLLPPYSGHSVSSSPSAGSNRSNSLSSPTLLNAMISQGSKPSHTCPSCSRTFSRAEHLDRHLTTHLPSNSSKSFICPSCGKGFTRKDVLTRHVRAVHETKRSDVRRSRRRSCRRCAGFKIKCSGGSKGSADGSRVDEACEACKKRGVMCVYDFGTHTESSRARGEDTGKQSGQDSGDEDMLDDISEEESNSRPPERLSKRRRVSDGYVGTGTSSVSQLLTAALLSSPDADQRMDEDSYTAAATVASLVNSAGTTSGDRDTISPRSTYATAGGDKPPSLSRSFSAAGASSHSPTITERRQNSHTGASQQPRLSLTPSQLLAQQPMAGGASSYRNNESPFRKASEFSGVPNSIYNSIRSPGGYGGADFSGNLPPLGYSHQQETLRTNSPKLFGGPLLTPIESRRDEVEDAEANQTDGDENWFFDSGIFETDWLRWGGLGTEPTPTTEQEHPPPGPSHPERHMSTCSTTSVNGNVPSLASSRTSGANSKDLSSPASTSSEYNAYPPNSRDIRLPSVSPIKDSSDRDDFLPWGWQASREEPRKRITLPPLRQVLGECSTQRHEHQNSSTTFSPRFSNAEPKIIHNRIGSVNDHIRTELISLLKLPYSRHPYYDDFDIESKFPSKELIDSFVALYFKHFHYNIPMIHRPTFKVENCPSILLVAMASIGASYSDVEGAKNFADGLSELCKRALAWMAEYDNGYLRSDYYLTAYCLQHLYALGSGHQALYDAADSSRSFLVSNARRCGLFNDTTSCYTPPNSTPPTSPRALITHEEYTRSSVNVNDDERHLNAQWASWCEQEKRKRVAWAIISYDCSFSTLSNRRGSICMNDIKARLPCDEAMWEAPTAHAWAALLPPPNFLNSKTVYRGMPFSATLRDVISGKQSPKEIPSWGKELCAWALGRLLWDFREMEQTALGCGLRGAASGLGLPALTDGLRETKEAVLSALGTLGDAAWENEQEELDSLHLNHRRQSLTTLIAHYSHLHFGVPTISLILSLARCPPVTSSSSSSSSGPSSSSSCPLKQQQHHQQPPLNDTIEDPRVTRLRSIFSENPVHARTIAWHAGQIIGISRHRPAHTPAETMRVFLAGVVLWGVAKWFVECRSMAAANMWTCGLNDGGDIPLDAVPMKPYGMPGRVAEWLKMGKGRATIRRDGPVVEGLGGVGGGAGQGHGEKEGDIQLCSEQGAKEVLQVVVSIIGRLRIWGLGGEFRRVLEGMGK